MDLSSKKELEIYAVKIRMGIIEGTYNAKAGHPGGSLSSADLFAYLYDKEMRYRADEPKWEDRDRFVLSKGHCAPGLYAALAYKGFFPVEDLKTLRHIGSYLQGHPNMNTVPGIDMSTGSLGQGVSVAAGMAKAAKYMNKDINVYTLLGDGEIEVQRDGRDGSLYRVVNHFVIHGDTSFLNQKYLGVYIISLKWCIGFLISIIPMPAKKADQNIRSLIFSSIVTQDYE